MDKRMYAIHLAAMEEQEGLFRIALVIKKGSEPVTESSDLSDEEKDLVLNLLEEAYSRTMAVLMGKKDAPESMLVRDHDLPRDFKESRTSPTHDKKLPS